MNIRPFVLYGLVGCPHCEKAVKFLQGRNIPGDVVIANGDPIADMGALWATKQKYPDKENPQSEYPVLVYRVTKEVVVGFNQDEYERLAQSYYALNGSSAPNVFVEGQQPVQQNPQPPAPAAAN